MFVDGFHDIADLSAGLSDVNQSAVLSAVSFDE